jgi:hypothetical protein
MKTLRVLKKVKIELPYDWAILTPGDLSEGNEVIIQ